MEEMVSDRDIIEAYDALVRRAIRIVNAWPGSIWHKPGEHNHYPFRLKIEGDKATLEWTEEGSYDSGSYVGEHTFPAEMLGWSDEQYAAWCKEEEARMEREYREDAERSRKESARKERELYEALKKKYE